MKKTLCFLLLSISQIPGVFATLIDGPRGTEEAACFELLNSAVSQDNRFKNNIIFPEGDLSRSYNEETGSYFDVGSYEDFYDLTVENPVNLGNAVEEDDYLFSARRNNIGTIISGDDYVYSQFTGFGRQSNFDFPLDSNTSNLYGDKYVFADNFFREYIVYTHHINSGDHPLLSCGIIKVTPLGGRDITDVSESGYMTNILNGENCSSGFSGIEKDKSGYDFYQMNANVCVQHYDGTDYLKMEVISVAFDNSSTRLNEFYTHQLQVEAMNDSSNQADGIKGIQDAFRAKLDNKTCYSVVHGTNNLPDHCEGQYGPISYQKPNFSVLDYLIPTTYAARPDNMHLLASDPENEIDSGMVVYGDLPYSLYKKLESIPNETFREYMLLSVIPNYEDILEHKNDNNVLLSPYEEVFLSCGLDYSERLEVVNNFLSNLDPDNFSLSELQYSDESYGDCIIPYPDADKISVVVEGSFEVNKVLAQKLNGSYISISTGEEIDEYINQREQILGDFNTALEEIESLLNRGEITGDQAKSLKNTEYEKYELRLKQNETQISESLDEEENLIIEDLGNEESDVPFKKIVLIGVLLILGLALSSFVFYRKRKK